MARVWICRWPNGDLSVVWGATPLDAVEVLDEVGSMTMADLIPADDCGAVHLRLRDDGDLEFEDFDERLVERVREQYPAIVALRDKHRGPLSDDIPAEAMAAAVAEERNRVRTDIDEAAPEHRALQRSLDMSGALLESYVADEGGQDEAAVIEPAVETPPEQPPLPKHRHRRRKD